MKVKILLITFLAAAAAIFCLWFYTIAQVSSKIEEEANNMSANVGKQIVINKDTLIVTDYNTILETYSLSNGTEVSKFLVENQTK